MYFIPLCVYCHLIYCRRNVASSALNSEGAILLAVGTLALFAHMALLSLFQKRL